MMTTRALQNAGDMLCSCQVRPLGLDFVLTTGCLVHDRCVCHEAKHGPAPGVDEACAWCASYIALLTAIGSLGTSARDSLKRALQRARAGLAS